MTCTPEDRAIANFATEALQQRLLALKREVRAAGAGGIGARPVHRMRVATRRLRSALEVFGGCFPDKSVRRWNRRTRDLRRALGEARDTDVRLAYLAGLLDGLEDPGIRPGVERLALRLTQRRECAQQHIVRAVSDARKSGVLREMELAIRAAAPEALPPGQEEASGALNRLACQHIAARTTELLAYNRHVKHPERETELHQMRIAGKRLRYTVEVFQPLCAERAGKTLPSLVRMQDLLGEIHDCDVWQAWLPEFEQEERERTTAYFGESGPMDALLPGIEHVRLERATARQHLHRDFAQYWQSLQEDGFFDEVRTLVSTDPG